MIELIDSVYTGIKGRSRLSSLARYSVRIIGNAILPLYFKLFSKKRYSGKSMGGDRKIIVSFTTFPKRIDSIWKVIECMLRQTVRPDKVMLYLSREQFPKELDDLPQSLRKYKDNGLVDVVFVDDDLRSHKKYYYSFQQFPEDLIILIDDDLFYVKTLISELLEEHAKFPESIICHRAHTVTRDQYGALNPYAKWRSQKSRRGPTHAIFHTSGGGTLYRPFLFSEQLYNRKLIKDLCFYADDVWLNVLAFVSGITIVKSNYYTNYLPVYIKDDIKLSVVNVQQSLNDNQLEKVLTHFNVVQECFID